MAKYIKIFFFLLLLGLTSLTTACYVEEIKESKNNGDIIIENNENYSEISTVGIIDGERLESGNPYDYNVKLIENCENNGCITVNNNTYDSSSSNIPFIEVCGINQFNKEIKNSTNKKNSENRIQYKRQSY